MSEMDYKPNSHKYKDKAQAEPVEQKRFDKVVKSPVKTKKKGELRKFADVFVSEDIHNVKSYILTDVLIPAAKKLITDVVTDGINMILYGATGRGGRSGSNTPYVSYRNYSDSKTERRASERSRTSSHYSVDDIIFNTRGEAENVLTLMDEAIERYKMVRVADFYDLAGVTGNYTDNDYGWTNLRSAEIRRVSDGYVIKLPRALPID